MTAQALLGRRSKPRVSRDVPRRVAWLIVPEGLVLLVGLGVLQWPAARHLLLSLGPLPWYILFVIAALLALRFGRTRALWALAAVLLTVAASHWRGPSIVPVLGVLLSLDLLIFALLPDRHLVSPSGLAVLGCVALEAFTLFLLFRGAAPFSERLIHVAVLPRAASVWTPVGEVALLTFAAAGAGLVLLQLLRPEPMTRGLLWVLIGCFLALQAQSGTSLQDLSFAVTGLVLSVAVVEDSFALAYRDTLTGLPARRSFERALAGLSGKYTIAMVDVDHFKQFNDQYGHDVGDQVLRLVASRLARVTGGGRVFRYGGEEFVLLFPKQSLAGVRPHLDAARRTVEACRFAVRSATRPPKKPKRARKKRRSGRGVAITVSIGAAEAGRKATTPATVVKAADRALYRAKEAGRNRVMV